MEVRISVIMRSVWPAPERAACEAATSMVVVGALCLPLPVALKETSPRRSTTGRPAVPFSSDPYSSRVQDVARTCVPIRQLRKDAFRQRRFIFSSRTAGCTALEMAANAMNLSSEDVRPCTVARRAWGDPSAARW